MPSCSSGPNPVFGNPGVPVPVVVPCTVNITTFDIPPPGEGLVTVTTSGPATAWSDAYMVAANWVGDTNVVGRDSPLKLTTEPDMNPDPLTVNVKPPLPAIEEIGEMLEINGMGLLVVPPVVLFTVNPIVLDVPPDGFVTVMLNVPAELTSEAFNVATTWFDDVKLVEREDPLKFTIAPGTNPFPFTVSVVIPLPAFTAEGEILEMDGVGLIPVTVNTTVFDVPPPGPGLTAVTLNEVGFAVSELVN